MSDPSPDDYFDNSYTDQLSALSTDLHVSSTVVVPPGMPFEKDKPFDPDKNLHRFYLELFYRVNYCHLLRYKSHAPDHTFESDWEHIGEVPESTESVLGKISYVRTLCARLSHYDYSSVTDNDGNISFHILTWQDLDDLVKFAKPDSNILITSSEHVLGIINQLPKVPVDDEWKNAYRVKHADTTCAIAYVRGLRGKMWDVTCKNMLVHIWHECLYDENDPGVDWKFVYRDCISVIDEDALNEVWVELAARNHCAGYLASKLGA